MLTVSAFGVAITIAHSDCDGGAIDDRNDMRRRASCRLLKRLLRREIASQYGTLTTEGSQGAPEAIYGPVFNGE